MMSRRVVCVVAVALLGLARPDLAPFDAGVSASAGLQRAGRGARGRIQERIERRRAETRGARDTNGRPPGEVRQVAGLSVAVWKPVSQGRAPLLVFSHGLNGCHTQSSYFMQRFADAGYLVVAPNHRDAACAARSLSRPEERLGQPGTWNEQTYRERGDDIRNLVAALRRDALETAIDWGRVGLVGHSLGGYTVLGVAGGWPGWKVTSPTIRAVLAWSPYCEPYAIRNTLSLGVPVMYQGGTRDLGITPSLKKADGCFARSGSPAIFVEFTGAGHLAWTDFEEAALDLVEDYSLEFLDRYVRGVSAANPGERVAGVSDLRVK